jgi:hypothetical protein
VHRGNEHVVNGKDRKPRSIALVETLRARNRLKHDDAEPRATEPFYRVAIEVSVRAPEFDIECALILKALRGAEDRAAVSMMSSNDDPAALHRFANDVERTRRFLITRLIHDRDLVSRTDRFTDPAGIFRCAEIRRRDHRISKIFATFLLEMPNVIDLAWQVRDRKPNKSRLLRSALIA